MAEKLKYVPDDILIRLYENFQGGSDEEFSEYLQIQGVGDLQGNPYTVKNISNRRKKLNLEIKEPIETLKYEPATGSIINTDTENKADQNQVLEWMTENPLTTVAGTSVVASLEEVPRAYNTRRGIGERGPLPVGKGPIRSAIGITGALKPVLTTVGTPAMSLALETLITKNRVEDGDSLTDVVTDPLGPALGLSFMEPLSKASGVIKNAPKKTIGQATKSFFDLSNVGEARPGMTGKALRLGMSPRMIAGASRFLGLPGLAITTGMAGYDAYKNYQNEEGMLYNLLNNND
jgi:hypothetical protein|tara:strand:+ start:177 stop:1049 length:873 start_codon:yes stop_codon:yes gene_type:complete